MNNRKKKIVIVMQSLNVGGVERALVSLLSVIPMDGYSVDLVLSKIEGDFLNRVPSNVIIHEAPYKSRIKAGEGITDILYALKENRNYVSLLMIVVAAIVSKIFRSSRAISRVIYQKQRERYDYIFNFAGVNNLTHLLSANIYDADNKYIWVHGDSEAEGFKKYKDVYSYYDRIFCVSNKVTEKLKCFMPELAERADTIYNELDIPGILGQSKEEQGLTRVDRETILLTVGRLDACKGYDIAIDACEKIKRDGFKIRWYIVGEGVEREKLEATIKEKNLEEDFILLGLKANPYPYYRTTDIYVQASISEGYCITLAEAKLFCKPIVTTNFSGADEQIRDNQNGYIVTADAKSIAEKIELLINDEEKEVKFRNALKDESGMNSFDKLEAIMLSDAKK